LAVFSRTAFSASPRNWICAATSPHLSFGTPDAVRVVQMQASDPICMLRIMSAVHPPAAIRDKA
jgi:hypothetical protein